MSCWTELHTAKDLTELTDKDAHEPPFTLKLYIFFSSYITSFEKKIYLIEYIHIV